MTDSASSGLDGRRSWWRSWSWSCRRELGWWSLYLAIALFASWPLALYSGSTISVGFETEPTVALLNVWTLWWNTDRLAAGFADFWNAPIFHPMLGAFAFSEAQPTMLVTAPVVWLTGNPVLAYNVYLWLILSLNGSSSRRLLLRVGHHPWLAFCGGVMCQMLPFIWWQSGVVQLTTLFGIVWTVHSLLDVFEHHCETADVASHPDREPGHVKLVPRMPQMARTMTQSLGDGLKLGGSFCVTYLLCNYWGLFLAMLLVPSSVWLWNASVWRVRFWSALLVAAIVSAAVLGPLVHVQKSLAARHEWTREQSLIRDLSAHARDYLDTPRTTTSHKSALAPRDRATGALQSANTTQLGNAAAHATTTSQANAPVTASAGVPVANAPHPDGIDPVAWSRVPRGDFPEEARRDVWPLGCGTGRLICAAFGLIVVLCSPHRRRWGLFAATFGAVALGLSLGPTVWFLPWVPFVGEECLYELLQRYVPGFALIRSPFRFALFVQLSVVWLSVEFFEVLNPLRWRRASARGTTAAAESTHHPVAPPVVHPALLIPRPPIIPPEVMGWCQWGPLVLASLLLVVEVWPPRQSLYTCPSAVKAPAWVLWLRENSAPDDAIVCLPFPTGYNVGDYVETTLWMYWGTLHRRALVNGYSGFFPKPFVDLKEKLMQFYRIEGDLAGIPQLKLYPWDSPAIKSLNNFEARFAIVKRSFASRDDVWQHPVTKFRWAWVTSDEEHQLDIYEILPSPEQ